MEPKREQGDDRVMIRMRPIREGKPVGGECVLEDQEGAVEDMLDGADPATYEIERVVVTANDWNTMPEFEGW